MTTETTELLKLDFSAILGTDKYEIDHFSGGNEVSKQEQLGGLLCRISCKLPNLKKLKVTNSGLKNIPPLTKFENLEELDLKNNNIKYLNHFIAKSFPKLKYLSLKNNRIEDISLIMDNLPKYSKLDLRENPLSLASLLKISHNTRDIIYNIDREHSSALNQIKTSKQASIVANCLLTDYPHATISQFNAILPIAIEEVKSIKDGESERSNIFGGETNEKEVYRFATKKAISRLGDNLFKKLGDDPKLKESPIAKKISNALKPRHRTTAKRQSSYRPPSI